MQGNNNNDNRRGGEVRLRDLMDRGNVPGGRNSGGIDRLLQMLSDWSKKVVSFFKNSSKGKSAPAAKAVGTRAARTDKPEEDRESVTIGGSDERQKSGLVGSGDMLSAQRGKIADWLKTTKFRTKLIAGVDEADVWKKIRQLNRMYDDALLAERARYEALLDHYREMLGEGVSGYGDSDEYADADDISEDIEYADETDGEEEYEYFDEDEYSDY